MSLYNGYSLKVSGYDLNVTTTTPSPAPGSANVVVNHNTVINPVSQRIGFNTNYWEDAAGRRAVQSNLFNAHRRLGVTYARWPGGHKADDVTFFLDQNGSTISTPTPRLARFGSGEWPATDATFWSPTNDYTGNFSRPLYNLPEFLEDCRANDTVPIIVVALDTIYNAPTGTGAHNITKAQAIANAVAMVQWCNVTNDYGVMYWELGNESWSNSTGYTRGYVDTGGVAHPETYGADFADMAAAMKAVDPTIKVGMNWNSQAGYQTAIAAAGSANVDFLAAHRYPFFGQNYAAYQAVSSPNMVSEANRATNAIATLSPADQARIFVMMTETGYTSQPNNLGSAVIHAHILGAQLSTSNIAATLVWNSRYPPYGKSHDMFNDLNELTPSGMGVHLASQLATPTAAVVTATSSVTDVFAYATYDAVQGRIAVLLINRSNSTQNVSVATAGMMNANLRLLSGTGSSDIAPTITTSSPTINNGVSTVSLPAASVGLLITTK
jgi:hypothetical protein